jgi:hypothetical protein
LSRLLLWAATALLVGACANPPDTATAPPATSATTGTPVSTTAPAPPPTSTTAPLPAPTTTVATLAPDPAIGFTGTVSPVTAAALGSSWRPGCPVGPDDLRLLRLSYWGFDDQPHQGSLVVAASATDAVLQAFRTVYEQRFPIRGMEPVDAFGGDDDASMAADNTSGFNCRPAVTDGPAHWSNHAHGLAVDVNPVENPYVLGAKVLPPAGADYLDRSVARPGMAVAGGTLTSAFAAVGWSWGGAWDASPDYQHFSANGG